MTSACTPMQIAGEDRPWYRDTFASLFNGLSPDYSVKVCATVCACLRAQHHSEPDYERCGLRTNQ